MTMMMVHLYLGNNYNDNADHYRMDILLPEKTPKVRHCMFLLIFSSSFVIIYFITIPDICLIFSTSTISGSIFLHIKRRNFGTKHISRQSSLHCDKTDIATICKGFLHITHFAPHLSCGEFSLCDRFSSHFTCGETSPHDNLSYGKFSPHDKFFSTTTGCDGCDKYQVWVHWEDMNTDKT